MSKNKVDLFSHLNNVNNEKDVDFLFENLDTYNPFMINRFLSMQKETFFFAEMMNSTHSLQKETQGLFHIFNLPKKKRYFKYPRKQKKEEDLKYIMDYYNTSERKAKDLLYELTEEQIKIIKKKFDYGRQKNGKF